MSRPAIFIIVPVKLVGVLPAAGRAVRLQPLAGSKELLEIGGRPVLDYAVERMNAASADEIRVVTRPDKVDVRAGAEARGLTVVEAEPATLAESIAVGIHGLAADDVVLIGLPDTIWHPVDGFARLVDGLRPDTDAVLGVFRSSEPERGDVVDLHADCIVRAVAVKPAQPAGDLIWGAAAARAACLRSLSAYDQPGHLFDELARAGRVRAVRFPGELVDVGTKEALARARNEVS
jgi:glucose-1-phosphate thymidylyltransferase